MDALLPAMCLILSLGPAAALSQIGSEDGMVREREGIIQVPLPPLTLPDRGDAETPADAPLPDADSLPEGERPVPADIAPAEPDDEPEGALPSRPTEAAPLPVRYGEDGLPRPVLDLRAQLIEIARSGEIERLRPYLETGAEPTALAVVPHEGDPIAFLRDLSGDGEGVEILAILLEVLLSGHVHLDEGEAEEIFLWPYFTQVPLDRLTRPQLVELFELVTAGDYQNMLANGSYDFYRVGISPGGRLEFFLAGD